MTTPRKMACVGFGTGNTTFPVVPTTSISSVSPASGGIGGGTTVRVTMPFACKGAVVKIGGTTCTITASSYGYGGYFDVTSPAGTAGAKDVQVTDLYGSNTAAGGFTYTGSALAAGTAYASPGDNTVALSASAPTGGTAPYTYQWSRSTTNGVKGSALTGKTTLTCDDATASNGTAYYYTLTATDSAGSPASVDYTQVTATPGTYAAPDVATANFNGGAITPYITNFPARVSVVDDPTPRATGKVCQIRYWRYSTLQSADTNPCIELDLTGASAFTFGETFYIRGKVFIPTPAANMIDAQRKLFYPRRLTGNSSDAMIFVKADGRNPSTGKQYLKMEYLLPNSGNGIVNFGEIAYDTWTSVEWRITVNSAANVADGICQFWVDGVLVLNKTDVCTIRAGTTGFGLMAVGDQCQHIYADLSVLYDEYRYWDDVAISTQRIGP
jgi:hypothetical protein